MNGGIWATRLSLQSDHMSIGNSGGFVDAILELGHVPHLFLGLAMQPIPVQLHVRQAILQRG